jgi:hypothetical protein
VILGVATARDLHRAVLADAAFAAGDTHVRFLDERADALRPPPPSRLGAAVAAAAAARADGGPTGASTDGPAGSSPSPSPWTTLGAFRVGGG